MNKVILYCNLLSCDHVIRVQISNADLVLKNGDTEQALTILRQITPEQRFVLCALNFSRASTFLNKSDFDFPFFPFMILILNK